MLTMKGMLLVKRARPELEPVLAFLAERFRASTQHDWLKLEKIKLIMLNTKDEALKLSADDSQNLCCHVGAVFGVLRDMRR